MDTTFIKSLQNDNLDYVSQFVEATPDIIHHRNAIGNTLLMTAVFWRANKVAKYLIDRGIDIHIEDDDGWNALFVAISRNNEEMAKILIEKGINFNHMDNNLTSPLMMCIGEDNPNIFRLLLENGADTSLINASGQTILQMILPLKFKSILNQNILEPEPTNLVETLELTDNLTFEDLEPGDKYAFRIKDNGDAYFMCKMNSILHMIDMKYKQSTEDSVFDMITNTTVPYNSIKFCRRGDIGPVFRDVINGKFKFEEGMDIDIKDPVLQRPLVSWLIKFKQYYAAKELISHGANITTIDRDKLNAVAYALKTDRFDIIPRHKIVPHITNQHLNQAVKTNNTELAKFLLSPEFNLDVNCKPSSILAIALENKNEELAHLILDKGVKFKDYVVGNSYITEYIALSNIASIAKRLCPLLKDSKYYNYINGKGSTPLTIAVSRDYYEIAKIFIENGADKMFKKIDGKIAFDLAKTPEMKVLLAEDPDKQIWVNTCKEYLDKLNAISATGLVGKIEKSKIFKEVFDYLYDKDIYINSHSRFKQSVINKALEILNDTDKDRHELKDMMESALKLYKKYKVADINDSNLSDLVSNVKI